jgi:hypothetical protein
MPTPVATPTAATIQTDVAVRMSVIVLGAEIASVSRRKSIVG